MLLCDLVAGPGRTATAAQLGGRSHAIAGDVDLESSATRSAAGAQERLGGVDVLVNNAGIARWAPFLEHSLEDWERTLAVDLTAVFLMSQRAARAMVEQGRGGAIVSTASSNGHVAEPGVAAYNAAKAGGCCSRRRWRSSWRRTGSAPTAYPGHVDSLGLAHRRRRRPAFLDGLADPIPLGGSERSTRSPTCSSSSRATRRPTSTASRS